MSDTITQFIEMAKAEQLKLNELTVAQLNDRLAGDQTGIQPAAVGRPRAGNRAADGAAVLHGTAGRGAASRELERRARPTRAPDPRTCGLGVPPGNGRLRPAGAARAAPAPAGVPVPGVRAGRAADVVTLPVLRREILDA